MTRTAIVALIGGLALFASALLFVGPGRYVDPAEERRLALEAAAQARDVTSTTIPASTTSEPPPVAPDDSSLTALVEASDLESAAAALLGAPSNEGIVTLARSMAATGDVRWVPYLLDLRLLSDADVFTEVVSALEKLTGQPPPEQPGAAYLAYGGWMYDNRVDPDEAYIRWKAQLFSLVDPLLGTLVLSLPDPVLTAQMQWGGVRPGGIPELNDQPVLAAADADYMQDDELTFGAVVNGQTRAYPHRILDHHELANDTLGGEPVALVNCTLCRTGVLYSRVVDGQVLDFITSGLLHNSNKVMMDRQTQSLWFQLTGEAIAGELSGSVLERFPITVARYGDWVDEHPDTDVVSVPTGFAYSYQPGDAYAEYYAVGDLWFPAYDAPEVFEPKTEVATVDLGDGQLAVSINELAVAGPQLIRVANETLAVIPTGAGARFYLATPAPEANELATRLASAVITETEVTAGDDVWPRVVSAQSFWFAWYGNHPTTSWWPTDE